MLVPALMTCCGPSRRSVEAPDPGQLDTPSSVSADPIATPGAAMSGFCRPSRVGPGLENVARFPAAGVPVKVEFVPLQQIQLWRDTHAAAVIRSTAFPGSLTSSWLDAPVTKLAVVPLGST